ADPQRLAAALARQLLWPARAQSRPDRRRLWPPGRGAASCPRHPQPPRAFQHERHLPARRARIYPGVHRGQFAARRNHHPAISDLIMRLRISHSTTYRYEPAATGVIQILRMTPGSHDGQYVAEWQIDVSADSRLEMREDAFGNVTHVMTHGAISDLNITVEGLIETHD